MSKYVRFETDVAASACWHCAEPKCDPPVRVPLVGGPVTGCFCSFSCAKRWCMDAHHTEAIVNLVISNGGKSVHAAPPRHCFKRFGGPFEGAEGRAQVQGLHELATPLKLTAAIEKLPNDGRQDSLFREFVKQRRYVGQAPPEPAPTRNKKKKKTKQPKKAKAANAPKKKKKKNGKPRAPGGSLAAFIVPAG